jgi:hypothetical protein
MDNNYDNYDRYDRIEYIKYWTKINNIMPKTIDIWNKYEGRYYTITKCYYCDKNIKDKHYVCSKSKCIIEFQKSLSI